MRIDRVIVRSRSFWKVESNQGYEFYNTGTAEQVSRARKAAKCGALLLNRCGRLRDDDPGYDITYEEWNNARRKAADDGDKSDYRRIDIQIFTDATTDTGDFPVHSRTIKSFHLGSNVCPIPESIAPFLCPS